MRVCLVFQLPAHRGNVAVYVGALGQYLELDLDRRDLQVADKAVDDTALLLGASQQEVDGDHLYDFDIAVIPRVNDAVPDAFDRHIVRERIERTDRIFLRQKGLVLLHLALFDVYLNAPAAFGRFVR